MPIERQIFFQKPQLMATSARHEDALSEFQLGQEQRCHAARLFFSGIQPKKLKVGESSVAPQARGNILRAKNWSVLYSSPGGQVDDMQVIGILNATKAAKDNPDFQYFFVQDKGLLEPVPAEKEVGEIISVAFVVSDDGSKAEIVQTTSGEFVGPFESFNIGIEERKQAEKLVEHHIAELQACKGSKSWIYTETPTPLPIPTDNSVRLQGDIDSTVLAVCVFFAFGIATYFSYKRYK